MRLRTNLVSLKLQAGIENSLAAKLESTLRSLEHANASNKRAAIGALNAFRQEVGAQRGKAILAEDADELIDDALVILGILEDWLV